MTGRYINGRVVEPQRLGRAAFVLRNSREPVQVLRVHNSQNRSGLTAVAEEDGVVDLANGRDEAEADVPDAGDRFDIRDLLLDEAD